MLKTLRTPETERVYQEFKEQNPDHCPYCSQDLLIQDSFNVDGEIINDWILIQNRFPYDRFYVVNDMLAPKEHISKLNQSQKVDLEILLEYLSQYYHQIIWNVPARQSISHFHVHLVNFE